MSKQVKISKIEIKIGSKTLSLSLDEAKEFKDRLDELFTEKVITLSSWPTYIPFQRYQPYINPIVPTKWDVYCEDSSNTLKFTYKN